MLTLLHRILRTHCVVSLSLRLPGPCHLFLGKAWVSHRVGTAGSKRRVGTGGSNRRVGTGGSSSICSPKVWRILVSFEGAEGGSQSSVEFPSVVC